MQKIPPAMVSSPVAGKLPGLGTNWLVCARAHGRTARRNFSAILDFLGSIWLERNKKQKRESIVLLYTKRLKKLVEVEGGRKLSQNDRKIFNRKIYEDNSLNSENTLLVFLVESEKIKKYPASKKISGSSLGNLKSMSLSSF
jgi:hypothetical protein